MKTKRNNAETNLVRAALQYLELKGVLAWRNNAGMVMAGHKGRGFRPFRLGLTGSADILGVMPPNGRILAAEAKSPTGVPSTQQRVYLNRIKELGGVAVVFRDLDTLGEAVDLQESNV